MDQPTNNQNYSAPICIGGVGGSGTRVVADVLIKGGIFMGSDLNKSTDNLLFTMFFKRPNWFRRCRNTPEKIHKAIRTFQQFLLAPKSASLSQRIQLYSTALGMWSGEKVPEAKRSLISGRLKANAKQPNINLTGLQGWGWKEPNTHFYLDYLAEHYPKIKYMHVIRHGLDMAYSNNQQQLHNFGFLYGIDLPENPADMPKDSLRYWIASNQSVVNRGQRLLGDRFMVLNFEELCAHPAREVARLLRFAGINPDEEALAEYAAMVRTPESSGRYKQQDLSVFTPAELDAVRAFKFSI